MGFWTSMKRMAMGEPVFQPGDSPDKHPPMPEASQINANPEPSVTETPEPSGPVTIQNGQKIIPEVIIDHIECHENGDNVEIWANLQNHGTLAVFIDKIMFLGQKTELNYDLSPGGARQSRLYHGPTPKTGAYTFTEMDYRLVETGDYFRGRYTIEYDFETDNNAYLPKNLKLQQPVRDI